MLMKLTTECSVREEGMGTSQISAKVSYLLQSFKLKLSLFFIITLVDEILGIFFSMGYPFMTS